VHRVRRGAKKSGFGLLNDSLQGIRCAWAVHGFGLVAPGGRRMARGVGDFSMGALGLFTPGWAKSVKDRGSVLLCGPAGLTRPFSNNSNLF
jgi:hypothetical protein